MITLDNIDLPLIAILRGVKPEEALEHAKALYEEGFRLIEVPTNSPEWKKSVTTLQEHFNGKAIIGAGTVLTSENYDDLRKTNGKLMVTPNFNDKLTRLGVSNKMVTCIGALTPTEVIGASQAGADIVKIFPAGNMGSGYCKSIMAIAPQPQKYYCVGGIDSKNLGKYLKIGFSGAGLGSDLYKPGQSVKVTRSNAKRYSRAYKTYNNEN